MVCGYEHDSMGSTVGEDARVIQCLQDYRCALALALLLVASFAVGLRMDMHFVAGAPDIRSMRPAACPRLAAVVLKNCADVF